MSYKPTYCYPNIPKYNGLRKGEKTKAFVQLFFPAILFAAFASYVVWDTVQWNDFQEEQQHKIDTGAF